MTEGHPGAADPLLGQTLDGRHRIEAILGRGGMGTVYAAIHLESGRRVAVKTLLPELNESPEIRRRFEREARAAGFLQHPNLVEVYEMGAAPDGTLYLIMELVEGVSVGDALDLECTIHPRRTLVIARQVLLGLGHAHPLGLVHRDLKPDNIMLARAGGSGAEYEQVKLLDFGVVQLLSDAAGVFGTEQLTRTGVTFGTPAYMAPEQALGRDVDTRADLYSLGIILFEMLTGRRPFESDESLALLRMHIGHPPPSLAAVAPGAGFCTDAMERLIARALAKMPGERYADTREMAAALEDAFLSIDHLPNR